MAPKFVGFRALILLVATIVFTPLTAGAQDIDADHYPALGFALLDADERVIFYDIAAAELCPCPGTPRTLDACLLEADNRCRLAEDVASLMMRRIKEDESAHDVRDAIVTFMTDAQTPRDFDLSMAPRQGSDTARFQIVIFSDFQCPFCRRITTTVTLLLEEFGDDLAVYYKHFPLPQHVNAMSAARASIAAQQQDRFWEMHDVIFENQHRLETEDIDDLLIELAEEAGLDIERFREDYDAEAVAARPLADREEGRTAGVTSTPSVFINGIKFLEEESYAHIRAYLNSLP